MGAIMTVPPAFSVLVGYGSDMGNAEDAALSFAEALEEALGVSVTAVELNQVELADLHAATHFVLVCSTWGEGEFPDNASLFWEAVNAESAARCEHLCYAVLALGDSGYEQFCNAGRLLDERLSALGGIRLLERVDVDGPYQQAAEAWTEDLVKLLTADHADSAPSVVVTETQSHPAEDPEPVRQGRSHPIFEARIAVNRLLTTAQSDREVRHYELDLCGSEIAYYAGDSIAVHATNDPVLVDLLLAELGVTREHAVPGYDEPLGVLLTQRFEIRAPSRALQTLVVSRVHDATAASAVGGDGVAAPGSWWYGKDVLDLIRLGELTVDEVVDTLRPLQSRDYSIASSPLVHPDHVHLTVATVRYTAGARQHGGVASTFLAERGDTVRVQLRPNHSFRLPAPDAPIIMIGPGTGIAPFRGFLQERQAIGATGRSWLFFGDRRRRCDFLYDVELGGFLRSGTLTRLDLAFSRDGAAGSPKQYVQQRMWENSAEIFSWLCDGAYVYVCGDAERMARTSTPRCGASWPGAAEWTRTRHTHMSMT
jgi:sulfite reductase (NADPH) flavoprotein alpha-component